MFYCCWTGFDCCCLRFWAYIALRTPFLRRWVSTPWLCCISTISKLPLALVRARAIHLKWFYAVSNTQTYLIYFHLSTAHLSGLNCTQRQYVVSPRSRCRVCGNPFTHNCNPPFRLLMYFTLGLSIPRNRKIVFIINNYVLNLRFSEQMKKITHFLETILLSDTKEPLHLENTFFKWT